MKLVNALGVMDARPKVPNKAIMRPSVEGYI